MRVYKKYLVGLTSAAMVFATVASAVGASAQTSAPAFSDISGNPEAGAITALAATGVVDGIGGGLYGPNTLVNRAEFAKIVVNTVNDGNIAAALSDETPSFTDAAQIPTWAWGYVNVAVDLGIVKGYPDGSFQPNGYVTDAEAAAMLLRAIGDDHAGVIQGAWPGNYVAAALSLGLTQNVPTFVANLPATRADIAQMAYNAATVVPVAKGPDANGLWTTVGGAPRNAIGGDAVFTGTVTGWDSGDVVINGTKYTLATGYELAGVSSLASLQNEGVTAIKDSSGDVIYLTANSSVTPTAGTLQCVNNNNNCTNSAGAIELSNGTVVDYEAGTKYYVNVPSTGILSDPASEVPDQTYLSNGDAISYTLDPATGDLASVTDTHTTLVNGIVTAICTSGTNGCNPNSGGSAVVTVQYSGNTTDNVTVQPYTAVTLNGASSSVSNLQNGDVVNVRIVGGSGTNAGQLGDGNATEIDATRNTVSGQLTSYTTNSSGQVTSLTVGGTQYLTDAQFTGTPADAANNLANTASVTLDSAGDVRAVSYTQFVGVLAVVSGYSETTSVSGVTYAVSLTSSTGSQTLNVPSADMPAGLQAGSAVILKGTPVNPSFQVLQAAGSATVTATTSSTAVLNYNSALVNDVVANSVFNKSDAYLGFGGLQTSDVVNVYTNDPGSPFAVGATTVLIDTSR